MLKNLHNHLGGIEGVVGAQGRPRGAPPRGGYKRAFMNHFAIYLSNSLILLVSVKLKLVTRKVGKKGEDRGYSNRVFGS